MQKTLSLSLSLALSHTHTRTHKLITEDVFKIKIHLATFYDSKLFLFLFLFLVCVCVYCQALLLHGSLPEEDQDGSVTLGDARPSTEQQLV